MAIPQVLTVREAREQLSSLLGALDEEGSDDAPVFIGSHRKPQGVLLSVEAYERLRQAAHGERRRAVSSATGSLRAEGLTTSSEYERDIRDYAEGLIDADELRRRTLGRYSGGPRNSGGTST
ncbi:type II toxin-antitoxin system Phd/YefM family antitoxin [Yinghuangia sp. ASG 101]|uniref:antitoxin VbhA family protein n=1 Tax=Yinghuangia sp. ASG 101 TaxID=2896848 RepID=UPI001E3B8C8D|nr:type II toxin-antitoxin system Phd/YefM family antitoxin [Yinghuangia sp. ASG 101]UGQ13771.1 type II toxin-antitoxin system Phd/YefM family antitoxin [Yinghuangia sp. ASG 101]